MGDTRKTTSLQAFAYDEIKLTDVFCGHAYEKEKAYLKSLQPERLLVGFRETAGIKEKEVCYGGWEQTEIKGHTLGHYLSALSQTYAYEHSQWCKEYIDITCEGLKACQREDGYLFASSEELFDRVENHQPAWVPWYTMHKILSGLLAAYELGRNEVAYEIADHLGNWIYKRCCKWDEKTQKLVLSVEYGGMNDCLYKLYELTHKEEHLKAAHCFDEMDLFEKFYLGEDVLNGLHANTTIPKVIGALHRYQITGEAYYLKAAVQFWNMVVKHHTYITGGNSEWEHFGMPDILDGERTACNCETCNTYNMLKLTQMLFQETRERAYASFYERTWINAILSSQNPETGMTTYFQPMETGFFKVYGTPYDRFWCCTGTGMENFTKLQEGIFYYGEDSVYINRYISSHLKSKEKQIEIETTTEFPNLEKINLMVKAGENKSVKLYLYIPEWVDGKMEVYRGGSLVSYEEKNGYAVLDLTGENNLTLSCPMKLQYEGLPDNPTAVAFKYGPCALSAPLGHENMQMTVTGVDVLVPTKDRYIKDYLVIEEGTVEDWLKDLSSHLLKDPERMVFHLKGTDEDERIYFVPHYSQYKERYGIYWKLFKRNSNKVQIIQQQEEKKWKHLQESVDCMQVGNDQYELAHRIKGEQTEVIHYKEHRGRVIKDGGWIKYEFKVDPSGGILNMVLCSEDEGRVLKLIINHKLLIKEKVAKQDEMFYTKSYEISSSILEGKDKLELVIEGEEGQGDCSYFDEIFIAKRKIRSSH